MFTPTFTAYGKDGNVTYSTTERDIVYERLAEMMVAHYIHKAPYIRRVREKPNWDKYGSRTIIFYFSDETSFDGKYEFIIR